MAEEGCPDSALYQGEYDPWRKFRRAALVFAVLFWLGWGVCAVCTFVFLRDSAAYDEIKKDCLISGVAGFAAVMAWWCSLMLHDRMRDAQFLGGIPTWGYRMVLGRRPWGHRRRSLEPSDPRVGELVLSYRAGARVMGVFFGLFGYLMLAVFAHDLAAAFSAERDAAAVESGAPAQSGAPRERGARGE